MHSVLAAIAMTIPLFAANTAANAFTAPAPTESQCAAIFKSAGDKYAGMWLASDGKLVLGLTSQINLDKEIKENLHIVYVKYGLAELEKFHDEAIRRKFNNNQHIFGTRVDQKINRVVITTQKENFSKIANLLKAHGVDLAMIHFENQHSTVTLTGLLDDGSCRR